jgi:ADP-ribose pyrophosphatase
MSDHKYLQPWKKLSEKYILETPWFKIRKEELITPRGNHAEYFIHDGNDGVLCVCVTEDGKFILEQQYRPPVQKISYDYPAGHVDPTDDNVIDAVQREVEEETGLKVGSLKKLATIDKDPGFSQNKMHIFLAKDLHNGGTQHFDATEDLVFDYVTAEEIKSLIKEGKLNCAFCVSATYFAFQELGIS